MPRREVGHGWQTYLGNETFILDTSPIIVEERRRFLQIAIQRKMSSFHANFNYVAHHSTKNFVAAVILGEIAHVDMPPTQSKQTSCLLPESALCKHKLMKHSRGQSDTSVLFMRRRLCKESNCPQVLPIIHEQPSHGRPANICPHLVSSYFRVFGGPLFVLSKSPRQASIQNSTSMPSCPPINGLLQQDLGGQEFLPCAHFKMRKRLDQTRFNYSNWFSSCGFYERFVLAPN